MIFIVVHLRLHICLPPIDITGLLLNTVVCIINYMKISNNTGDTTSSLSYSIYYWKCGSIKLFNNTEIYDDLYNHIMIIFTF